MISTLELILRFFEPVLLSNRVIPANLHLLTHFDLQLFTHQVTSAETKYSKQFQKNGVIYSRVF